MPTLATDVIKRLKSTIVNRAGSSFKLANTFKLMDTNRSQSLDIKEFESCLNKIGFFMSRVETQAIFKIFDKNGDKCISMNEFLNALKDPLSKRRLAMVKKCFNYMDKDNSGIITKSDIADLYSTNWHPDVIAGKRTVDQILEEYLSNFEGTAGNRDGEVTWNEFLGYYEELSMGIPSDD